MEESVKHKIPIIRIIMANADSKKMINTIAKLYNIEILKDKNIDDICTHSINDILHGEFKNFWKGKTKVKNEFDELVDRMNFNRSDFDFSDLESTDCNRCASLLAIYGFRFINAVEVVWETSTQEQLKDLDTVVALLKKEMNRLSDDFLKLCEAIKIAPWRDPTLDVHACDGVAWKLEAYDKDGSIDKTSGTLGYIYGNRVLETIVSLLPQDGNLYDSSAFISINRASDTTKNTTE